MRGVGRFIPAVEWSLLVWVASITATAATAFGPGEAVAQQAPVCTYRVLAAYPHDPGAFTQGLVYADGELFESTGTYGESSLRRVALESGEVLQIHELSGQYFAEGLTLRGSELIQLTWRENTAFVYDSTSFAVLGEFPYATEGWGITYDGRRLIMSDGSSTLFMRDPQTFAETGQLTVHDDGAPVIYLNELEAVAGEIFANVWTSDRIARINPATGEVIAWVDLAGLLQPPDPSADVLNGIAYGAVGNRLFVTGKWWHTLYEIELVGCPDLLMFADSFESGDLLGWSESGGRLVRTRP